MCGIFVSGLCAPDGCVHSQFVTFCVWCPCFRFVCTRWVCTLSVCNLVCVVSGVSGYSAPGVCICSQFVTFMCRVFVSGLCALSGGVWVRMFSVDNYNMHCAFVSGLCALNGGAWVRTFSVDNYNMHCVFCFRPRLKAGWK